jgi:hypothetical protein
LRIRQREAEAHGLWALASDLAKALQLIERLERERMLIVPRPREDTKAATPPRS